MNTTRLVFLALGTLPCSAQPAGPALVGVSLDIAYPTGGVALDTTAYLTTNEGISIYDLSDPDRPAFVRTIALPACRDADADGDTLVALLDTGTVVVFDATDPTAPAGIGAVGIAGSPDWVSVEGSLAIIGDYGVGVWVVDLTDPTQPGVSGPVSIPNISGAAVTGTVALVSESNGGPNRLTTLDLSTPATPAVAHTWVTVQRPSVVVAQQGVAFVAMSSNTTAAYDVTDASSPLLLDEYALASGDLALDGDTLIIGAGRLALTLDVSDPGDIRLGARQVMGGPEVFLASRDVVIGAYEGRVEFVDADAPSIAPVAEFGAGTAYYGVSVNDGLAYLTSDAGIVIVDVTNPTEPSEVGTLAVADSFATPRVVGGLAYLAAPGGTLLIVDVTDPSSPAIVGQLSLGNSVRDIAVEDGIAYVANNYGGLKVVDVSDPENPALMTTLADVVPLRVVRVRGGVAYLGSGDGSGGPVLVDVQDPLDPSVLGVANGYAQRAFDLFGDLVFSADDDLDVFDVSAPGTPGLIGWAPTMWEANDIDRVGSTAFVTTRYGVTVFDLSNPVSPTALATIQAPADPAVPLKLPRYHASAIAGGLVLAATEAGLLVFDPAGLGVCVGDSGLDGSLNLDDIDAFAAAYLAQAIGADLDGDGAVSLDDLDAFAAAFLRGCP